MDTQTVSTFGGLTRYFIPTVEVTMFKFLVLLSFVSVALAAPLEERQTSPSVTINNGTVIGSSASGVDSFKGIPFAQPPVGSLRLKPPQSITSTYGTIEATGTPTACPQFYSQVDTTNIPSDVLGLLLDSPAAQQAQVQGENCLVSTPYQSSRRWQRNSCWGRRSMCNDHLGRAARRSCPSCSGSSAEASSLARRRATTPRISSARA